MDVPPENDRCAVSMTTIIFPVKPIALAGFAEVASCKFGILQQYPGGHVDAPYVVVRS